MHRLQRIHRRCQVIFQVKLAKKKETNLNKFWESMESVDLKAIQIEGAVVNLYGAIHGTFTLKKPTFKEIDQFLDKIEFFESILSDIGRRIMDLQEITN